MNENENVDNYGAVWAFIFDHKNLLSIVGNFQREKTSFFLLPESLEFIMFVLHIFSISFPKHEKTLLSNRIFGTFLV